MSKNDLGTSMDEAQLEQSLVGEHINNSNIQGLKKIIYKYQHRIRQLHKNIHKQKMYNDQLKEQLKQLNDTLNQLINKVAVKPKHQKEDNHKQEIIKKELDTEMKKNYALKKQIQGLKAKLKAYESQKLGDLHNQIREKDRVIQDLHQSLKLYQRFEKKQMHMDIYRKQQQAQKKINMLTEEIAHLRKKTQDQRKQYENQERSMIFQSRKMKQLQHKQQSLPKKIKNDSEGPKQTYHLLQQQNKQMKEQLEVVQKQKKIVQKFHKGQLQLWKTKVKTAQKQNTDLREDILKKDKQIHSLWLKIKSLNSGQTDRQFQQQSVPSWIQLLDCRREIKGSSNIKSGAKRFDDCQKLPRQKQYRISGLLFRFFQEHIIELRVTYEVKGETKQDKQQIPITSFAIETHYQSTREVSIQLSDYEYIVEWEIYLGKGIQYTRIRTSKEQILEAGNERNSLKCKRLPFDIKSFQKPIACFGITSIKNIGEKQREVLVALGLVLKRKNVFGGRAHSLARLQKPSLSVMNKYNDKNIV